VHVPKLKDTVGLLDKAAFDKMKDGVMVINCARAASSTKPTSTRPCAPAGSRCGAGRVRKGAAGECPLFEIDRVICTPHLGQRP